MLRGMLLGLDGSTQSDTAVELGLAWAKRCGAVLAGLGVVDAPAICAAEPVPIGGARLKRERDEALLAQARSEVERYLDGFARRCAEARLACRRLEAVGVPAEQLVREAQRYDLILLGQRTFLHYESQWQPGDTLKAVVSHAPCPVVVASREPPVGEAVLVACDGSLQAARALHGFVHTGMCGQSELHVLAVHARREEAEERGSRAVDYLQLHQLPARLHAVESSASPAAVILEHVERLGAALVVMGAYGRSTLHDFFLGSVTHRLLEQANVPLLLYH